MDTVEKFDPSKLMDGVKDRIKATFVSLIPDDQWENMCDTEMKKFFQPSYSGWDNKTKNPSEFEKIVTELMKEKCRQFISGVLGGPEYSIEKIWGTTQNQLTGMVNEEIKLSDHLDNMIKEKMPAMLQAMFATVMADAFSQFFTNVRQRIQNV